MGLLIVVIVLTAIAPASASHPAVADYHAGKISKYESGISDMRTELESIPVENWGDAHLAEYSSLAFWLTYHAYTAYLFTYDDIPNDFNDLLTAGFISEIPGNPLREWEPMQVLEISDGFSAGDLVIQTAPASHYSIVGSFESYDLRPLSYELSVYGPSESHFQGVSANPSEGNTWAIQPSGILVMAGVYCESADITLEKIEARLNALEEDKIEEGENE